MTISRLFSLTNPKHAEQVRRLLAHFARCDPLPQFQVESIAVDEVEIRWDHDVATMQLLGEPLPLTPKEVYEKIVENAEVGPGEVCPWCQAEVSICDIEPGRNNPYEVTQTRTCSNCNALWQVTLGLDRLIGFHDPRADAWFDEAYWDWDGTGGTNEPS